MLFFKNHFGMIVSTVIALILSFFMAASAFIVDSLTFTLPALIRGWGVSFLVIMITTILVPTKILGDKLASAFGLKPDTLPFGLVSNLVPTFIYNLFATLAACYVNIIHNENIPAEAQAGIFTDTVLHDLPIMFVIAYVLSLIAERIAFVVAEKSIGRPPYGPGTEA